MRLRALLALMVVMAACPTSRFGAECDNDGDCADLLCRDLGGGPRCVPPRARGDAGESCENPLRAQSRIVDAKDLIGAAVVVDETVFFDAATDDGDFCGGAGVPDLALDFSLLAESGLKIQVDDPGVVVGLRPAGCGAVVPAGCASQQAPALVSQVPAGEWVLELDGVAQGGVHVVVSRIDCPAGYLPFDDDECVGFREMQPLLRARGDAGGGTVANGQVIVLGGIDVHGNARSDGERFDPLTESFSFVDTFDEFGGGIVHPGPAVVTQVAGLIFALGGNDSDRNEDVVDVVSLDATGASLPEPVGQSALTLYDVVFLDEPVGLTERGLLTVGVTTTIGGDTCFSNAGCASSGERCLLGECVALQAVSTVDTSLAALTEGTRGAATGADSFVVLGAERGVGFRVFLRTSPGAFIEGRPIESALGGTPRRDSALAAAGRFVYVFGGLALPDEATAPSEPALAIERVDAAGEVATVVGQLPVPMAAPRAVTLRDRYIAIFDGGDRVLLFDSLTSSFLAMPPLPVPRRNAAFIPSGDAILIAGGFSQIDERPSGEPLAIADVRRLELVPRSQLGPPEQSPPHCSASELPLDGTTVSSSTGGARDRFRDEGTEQRCAFSPGAGDEHWRFSLDEASSVQITTIPTDGVAVAGARVQMNISVSAKLCEETSPVVECGVGALFIPQLPAGEWFVSIESRDPFFRDLAFGRPYTIAAQRTCGDEGDPGDDLFTGAIELVESADLGFVREGGLCAGDVDHLLVQHVGGDLDLVVTDFTCDDDGDECIGPVANGAQLATAVLDAGASRIAGRPLIATVGEPLAPTLSTSFFAPGVTELSFGAQPLGYYLLQLGPVEVPQGRVEWNVTWAPDCTPDASDSVLDELDEATDLGRAPRLAANQTIERTLCHRDDRDVIILEPDRLGTMFVEIDDPAVDVAFFAFDPAVGALGAPIDAQLSSDSSSQLAILPPSLESFALLLTVGSADTPTVLVDFDISPPGDLCETAEALPSVVDAGGTLSASSEAFRNDLEAADLGDGDRPPDGEGCTGFVSPGEDRVFALTLGTDETLAATLTPNGPFDIGLYLLTACPSEPLLPVCATGADVGGVGDAERLIFTNTGAAATFFLVVDSFDDVTYEYDLTWSIE